MLAYVFWHWPGVGHPAAEYEQLQCAFHLALAKSAPSGFERSAFFRVDGQAPWLGGTPAYVDWYLVQDSAALDPLNVAAVSGVSEAPHAAVANAWGGGAGLLLALRGETPPELASCRGLTFLTKPRGMPYADFYAAVPSIPNATLWRRMMVLGPTPEFALLTQEPAAGLSQFNPLPLRLTPVWP